MIIFPTLEEQRLYAPQGQPTPSYNRITDNKYRYYDDITNIFSPAPSDDSDIFLTTANGGNSRWLWDAALYGRQPLFTIEQIKTIKGREGQRVNCVNGKTYRYVSDSTALTGTGDAPDDDDIIFLTTPNNGDTRWFCVDALPYVVFDKNNGAVQASGTTNAKITWAAKDDKFLLGDLDNERFGGGVNGVPLGHVWVNLVYLLGTTTSGHSFVARIYKNGADVKTGVRRGPTGNNSITVSASGIMPITSTTDYIEGYCDTQSSHNISSQPRLTYMEIAYLHVSDWRE